MAASGSAVRYYYVEESTPGVTPASPTFKPIRFNTGSLTRNVAQVESAEINSLRQRPPAKQGTYSTQGEIVSELSSDSFDDLLSILMQQSSWSANALKVGSTVRTISILKRHTDLTKTLTASDISAAESDSSFNSVAGAFAFAVGDFVRASGFTDPANNGLFRVATATANKITVTDASGGAVTLADEAAGDPITLTATDDTIYRGCRLNTLSVATDIDARVLFTFGVIGTEAVPYGVPVAATFDSPTTSEPMVTSVGSISEGGNTLAIATSHNFTLNNGMAPLFTLHNRAAFKVQNGIFTASGTLSAYRESGGLFAKFLNETATEISQTFSDGSNTYTFTFPNVRYTQADDAVPGPDAIVNSFTYSAGYDGTAQTTVTISRSA